jgi:GT2 family glycosyltransferase
MTSPTVSLVVVNYNSGFLTLGLLDAAGEGADEVVIVDNASPDRGAGLDAVESAHPAAKIVRLSVNGGYGAGANEGARHATGTVIVVSNPDVTLSGQELRQLAGRVGDNGVVLAAPRFVDSAGSLVRSAHRREPRFLATLDAFCGPFAHVMRRINRDWHPTAYPSPRHGEVFDCEHVLGALMAVDAEAFRAIGGFDTDFFMYREETDLCRRLRQRGGRIRHAGDIEVAHVGGASTASDWPYQGNVWALTSHYRYIAKHWGRITATAARLVGAISSALWFLAGPRAKRPLARRALRWHVSGRREG